MKKNIFKLGEHTVFFNLIFILRIAYTSLISSRYVFLFLQIHGETLHVISNGTSIAQEECQNQFEFSTWNCPVVIALLDKNDCELIQNCKM